jgi:hypothetical protein
MNRESLPPLLRGVGSTMILLATITAIVTARRDIQNTQVNRAARERAATEHPVATGLEALTGEIRDLKSELEERSATEEVLESSWVEMLGIVGTAFIACSFYAEAIVKMRAQPNNEDSKPKPSDNLAKPETGKALQ